MEAQKTSGHTESMPLSLSPQEQEEVVIHLLENYLRRAALGRNAVLPRWAIW
jgi:hypothetical protein